MSAPPARVGPEPPRGFPARIGFFGKMPARGDFVRSHLSHAFADAVHAWMGAVLPSLEALLGPDWPETWAGARPWRFAAGAGVITREVASGAWLPSADRVGRSYPLVIAIENVVLDEAALAAAEAAGSAAVRDRLAPDGLMCSLAAIPPAARPPVRDAAPPSLWWRETGETLAGDALPVGQDFIELLAP